MPGTPGCSPAGPGTGRSPLSEPVDVGSAPDPVAAVLSAYASGRPVALRTSGTTGQPRSVLRSVNSWVRSFEHVARLTDLQSGSRLWLPGPLSATMNLFAAVLARSGGAVVVGSPEAATHAHLTPLALRRALDEETPLAGMHVTVAGDRLTGEDRIRAEARGARVSHYYGAAELSFVAWGRDEHDLRPFPEVELEVRAGAVWVRSPYLCVGYDGAAGPLARDSDGFATVGDRGRLVDGRLVVEGRGDAAVVTGGATVLVADVENALRDGLLGDLVVVGVPHPTLGQVVAAVVTRPDDAGPARERAGSLLSAAQRPRLWFHLEPLPMTGTGKLDRTSVLAAVTAARARPLVPTSGPRS